MQAEDIKELCKLLVVLSGEAAKAYAVKKPGFPLTIQQGGRCFNPDTVHDHASYAFNNYPPQPAATSVLISFSGLYMVCMALLYCTLYHTATMSFEAVVCTFGSMVFASILLVRVFAVDLPGMVPFLSTVVRPSTNYTPMLCGTSYCLYHTGSEAMFADLGHFNQLSIQVKNIAFTCMVYRALILAYMGQVAYLCKHHIMESDYRIGFYVSVPEKIRWPIMAIAILATVVGSQAVITGTFSMIKQCASLGCFPRVKIIHTSAKVHGQIYIPEINWIMMIMCLAVTIGFRNTKHLRNASGWAIITLCAVANM
eukprot:XP_020404725.1 potassium transporter 10 [Zea mays]